MNNTRRRLKGVVKKSNSAKTLVVEISRTYRHPLYQKVIYSAKNIHVHDEFDCHVGDIVQIVETKPISNTKRWTVEKRLNVEEDLAAQDVLPEVPEEDIFGEKVTEEMPEESMTEVEEDSDDSA